MLVHRSSATPVEMLPGVVRRTLTEGERMMLIEVTLAQGAVVPPHTHPHEQIGYLASGRLLFEVGDERRELTAGDSWLVPSNVSHQVTALEPSVAIDIFSPPREEYRA
ncbi:MAG TPA: cupin domain-containing protein [Dehalococcoidia bacterium]|nr:cupin domain-containing protein [Dehalococcoidia bacterium]